MSVQRSSPSRSGATLLVTLGILAVLSVMVVSFLLSTRHLSLSAKHFGDKTVARQALDFALTEALRSVDDAMSASNYLGTVPSPEERFRHRAYPLRWWHAIPNRTAFEKLPYQNGNTCLLRIPDDAHSASNNLLSSEVAQLLPVALTNWTVFGSQPLKGGWTNFTAETRVSYAVFNCSGFIDVHSYDATNDIVVATTQHVARVYFGQQDLLRDQEGVARTFAESVGEAANNPFYVVSYDPNPNAMPLERDNVQVATNFGTRVFKPAQKFDICSITNHFLSVDGMGVKKRLVVMPSSWFDNVTRLIESVSVTNLQDSAASFDGRDAYLGESKKVAWNIVNYMTESRIPTAFSENAFESNTASRLDYAIEAVPLINEVELKDIFNGTETQDNFGDADPTLYGDQLLRLDGELRALFAAPDGEMAPNVEIYWSNIYAFDVELWYPFKPVPAPENAYLWLSATTNSPPAFSAAQSPYAWLNDNYDTLGYVLFNRWNELYLASSNTSAVVTNDVVWEAIQTNAVLQTYVENPDAFNGASNQTEVAEAIAALWAVTYLSEGALATTSQPYTVVFMNTTSAYTNRLTQGVLSNDMPAVSSVLHSPFSGMVDWGDATAWAHYFQELFKASSSQFSAYEKHEILPEWFDDSEYRVLNSTNLVYLPYVVTNRDEAAKTETIVIRFKPLSEGEGTDGSGFHAWLRPMVTVSEIDLSVLADVDGIPEVVDEALLNHNGNKDTGYYKRWDKPGSISVDDPRDNAWTDRWSMQDEVPSSMGEKNGNCNVAEYPFIHLDQPFRSIGELGYINVDLTNRFADVYNRLPRPSGEPFKPHDTIDFATRSGAALLDKFCIGGYSNSVRGLVQANTTHGEVIRRVLNQTPLGWPEDLFGEDYSEGRIGLSDSTTSAWVDHWTNTLFKAYGASSGGSENDGVQGWSCFAEMLPDLSTNALLNNVGPVPVQAPGDNPGVYDYLEDVMRGLIDKVSFRQNVYVVVIAAQTLSPASTDEHPLVLADQRAAVTVIRDAFTGRWAIYDWTWLTE